MSRELMQNPYRGIQYKKCHEKLGLCPQSPGGTIESHRIGESTGYEGSLFEKYNTNGTNEDTLL